MGEGLIEVAKGGTRVGSGGAGGVYLLLRPLVGVVKYFVSNLY